ncbi:MAG: TIGR04283 family arsenosugar biosynthesis glycosyltransferase [Ignavibacteriae bacterium]|nr:TIGR04283 family arsenosugar biosynthesis glycosyltransferase [Ignavibacteriota bacterium]
MNYKYSVIIPTLNEETKIKSLLPKLLEYKSSLEEQIEIIVVDGKSEDETKSICVKSGVIFLESETGRGIQMNNGAIAASGEILIFLHADTELPENIFEIINEKFSNKIQLATFRLKFDDTKMLYKLYSFFTKFDSVFSTFGDQVIIVGKEFYNKLGGFKNYKIMEDVDFIKRARKFTKIIKFNNYVITSVKKFEREGIIKTQIKNFILIIGYLFGVSTEKIYELYYNTDKKRINNFHKISGIRKGKNKVGFINK